MVELEENGCPQFDESITEQAKEPTLEDFCDQMYHARHDFSRRKSLVITLIGKENPSKASEIAKFADKLLVIFERLMKKYQRYLTIVVIVGNHSWYEAIKSLRYIRMPAMYIPRLNVSAIGLSIRLGQLLDTDCVIAFPGGRMTSIERNMALEAGLPVFDIK